MARINVCFYSDHSSRPNKWKWISSHSQERATLLAWPRGPGTLMEMKAETSPALEAKTAAGAPDALQGSATSLSCYFTKRGLLFFFWHSCTSTESIRQPEDFQHISRLLNSELLLTLLSSRYSNPHPVLSLLFYNPSLNFSWELPFSRICPTLSITTSFHQDFSYTSPHQSASQYQTSNPKFQLCLHWNKPFCEKQGASPASQSTKRSSSETGEEWK